jgi:CAAX protease family protein
MGSRDRRAHASRRFMTWLLRSPFADLVDSSVLLITVLGRRSAAEYTFPVQYAQTNGTIWVVPGHHERKTWWRNLVSEAPVRLHLRGQDLAARAQSFSGATAPSLVEEGLRAYVRRFAAAGRRSGIVTNDGALDEERLAEVAKSGIVVRIEPMPGTVSAPEAEVPPEAPVRAGPVGAVRRHPLAAFYIIAFLVSWGYWVPDALAGGRWSHAPGLLGPMIAAIVVTGLTKGSAGLRDLVDRMVRWRVRPRWYVWAMAPVGLALGVAGVLSIFGGPFPPPGEWSEMSGFASIGGWAAFVVILVVNGYGEETGWRGFATPTFRRRHNEITASLLVAIPWALWHVPIFFIDSGYGDFPLVFLPGWLLGFFALAIVLTWIYEGARSSILVAALMHVSLNVATATRATEGAVSGVVTMGVIAWSIVIAARWQRRLRSGRHQVAERDGGGRGVLVPDRGVPHEAGRRRSRVAVTRRR